MNNIPNALTLYGKEGWCNNVSYVGKVGILDYIIFIFAKDGWIQYFIHYVLNEHVNV